MFLSLIFKYIIIMFFSLIFKYLNKFYIVKKITLSQKKFIWRLASKAKLEIKPIESQI